MGRIAEIFRKSPFEAIREHMCEVTMCVNLLKPLFEALANENYYEVEKIANEIIRFENSSDNKKSEIRKNLPKEVFLPVSRRDLLQVVNAQDSIADTAEEIANMMLIRKTTIPEELKESLFAFLNNVLEVCEIANNTTESLLMLVKRSFGGPELEKINQLFEELDEIEFETNELGVNLSKKLFELEKNTDPISILFLYKIIEHLVQLANYSKKMGNRLKMLVAG